MTDQQWIDLALACGATKAAVIKVGDIVQNESFRQICAGNGCGNYGTSWACPPGAGEYAALETELSDYNYALWYQSVGTLEDSFDYEGMVEAGEKHSAIGQRLQQELLSSLQGRFRHLSNGKCKNCADCTYPDAPCRFPEKCLPSLSGWGVDVSATTKGTDLKYINGENTVTYFGAVLFTEADHA